LGRKRNRQTVRVRPIKYIQVMTQQRKIDHMN